MRALLILLAGQAMAVMDGSILAVAAPSLRTGLHASDAQLQLVVAMYTIAFATLVVTGARLGDVLGRRRTFLLRRAGAHACGAHRRAGVPGRGRRADDAAGSVHHPVAVRG
jgi:MFS family permease